MGWIATSRMDERGTRKDASPRAAWSAVTALDIARLRPGVKRSVDVVAASALLVAILPLLLLIAVAIKVDSRGPVFYRVRRVGYRGRTLMMFKFRKMYLNAVGIPLTAHADERLTRVGRVLAQTRLDELPQLWDVLRGRMSIVGPRPEDPGFVALHADDYESILSVRPGMTGLSQLAYAEERKILDKEDLMGDYVARVLPQKISLDTLYADSYRLEMDLAVIWWTVVTVMLRRPVAVHRSSGRMNLRRRARPAAVVETCAVAEQALAQVHQRAA